MRSRDNPVRGTDLDWGKFNCCPNAELLPFKCSACGLPMVFCVECGTLYSSLPDMSQRSDVNHFDSALPSHHCPRCEFAFEYHFSRNAKYQVTRAEWNAAGLDQLLAANPPASRPPRE